MSILLRECAESEGRPFPETQGPIPWERFTAELLELYEPPMRARATYRQMRRVLDLVGQLGVASTAEFTPKLVARFIAARPKSENPNTTYSLIGYLRAACNIAAGQGYCRVSPFALRKGWVRRTTPRPKFHHSREEIARVLGTMRADVGRKSGWSQWRSRRLYALAATVAYTGLRRNEALHLRTEDLLLSERMILVRDGRANRLKTEAAAQPVPVPEALVQILAEWLPHLALPAESAPASCPTPEANPDGVMDAGWVFPNSYRTGPWTGGSPGHKPLDRMKRLGERAGVKGFTFLSLRHSWATHAEYWGLSDAIIQRVLRHTNTRTQWHYRHADADNLRDKVRGLGFGHDLADAEAGSAAPAPAPVAAPGPKPGRVATPGTSRLGPKLDDADAVEMRRLRAGGWSYKALVGRFGVSKSTVHYTLYRVIHRGADGGGEGACG